MMNEIISRLIMYCKESYPRELSQGGVHLLVAGGDGLSNISIVSKGGGGYRTRDRHIITSGMGE